MYLVFSIGYLVYYESRDSSFLFYTRYIIHDTIYTFHMLFERKNQKRFRMIWTIICALIIISMIILYTPIFR